MPLLNRGAIANFFGLADEEEYEYQDYPETTKKAVQPTKKNTTQNQSTHSVSAANTHEKQKTATSRPVTHESIQPAEKKKVIELHQSPTKTVAKERTASRTSTQPKANLGKITVMEPRAYSEAMAIAKRIIAGEATLVNFHLVEEKQARRIVDFLTGTVYALDGDIKRVGDEIFLCTPTGMEIDSSTAQSFADANLFDL
ncbi:TPA: cell division protein SepF [Enterococcus faecium]